MDERAIATRRVMKSLARFGQTGSLPVKDSDGATPVIVALESDPITFLIEQSVKYGGTANVFVPVEDRLALIQFEARVGSETGGQPARDNMTVGMFIAFLKMQDGEGSVNITLSSNGSSAFSDAHASSLREVAYAF